MLAMIDNEDFVQYSNRASKLGAAAKKSILLTFVIIKISQTPAVALPAG
jgi:hypothetical protein